MPPQNGSACEDAVAGWAHYAPGTVRPLRLHGGGNAESMGRHGGGTGASSRSGRRDHGTAASAPPKKQLSFLSHRKKFATDYPGDTTTAPTTTSPPSVAITQQNTSLVAGMLPSGTDLSPAPHPPRRTMTILAEMDEQDCLCSHDCRSLEVTLEPRLVRQGSSLLLRPNHSLHASGTTLTVPEMTSGAALLEVEQVGGVHGQHPSGSLEPCSRNVSMTGNALLSSTEALTSTHRLFAAPVVPIVALPDDDVRRRKAREMEERFAGNVDDDDNGAVVVEKTPVAATDTTAPPPGRQDGKKDKTRKSDEERKTRQTTSGTAAVLNKRQAIRAAREQVIRVGAQRLQRRLDALHLVTHRIKNDGNCQFRAIAYQLLGSEDYDDVIRDHVISYMKRVRARDFDQYFETTAAADAYFDKITKSGSWGDELTLRAASDSLYINIHVLSSQEKNFYITYRPSPDAPPPPTFLLDVQKVRARRRRERVQRRWQQQQQYSFANPKGDSMDGAALLPPYTSQATSIDPHTRPTHNDPTHRMLQPQLSFTVVDDPAGLDHVDPDDAEDGFDACGVQQLLQRRLTQTDLVASSSWCSTTVGHARDLHGGLSPRPGPTLRPTVHPTPLLHPTAEVPALARNATTTTTDFSMSPSNSSQLPGLGRGLARRPNSVESSTLPTPVGAVHVSVDRYGSLMATAEESSVFGAESPVEREDAVRRGGPEEKSAASRTLGALRDGAPQQQRDALLRKFTAAGAELQSDRNVPVNVVQHTQMTLLQPARDDVATRPRRLLQPTRADPTPGDDGVPTFHTNEEGDVVLLAAASLGTADGRALRQTFAALQQGSFGADPVAATMPVNAFYTTPNSSFNPLNPHSATHAVPELGAQAVSLGTHPAPRDEGGAESDVFFVFENRVEPIDVFLSYLYPVHYNALVVADPGEEEAAAEALQCSGSLPDAAGGVSPQSNVISVPFLRRKAV